MTLTPLRPGILSCVPRGAPFTVVTSGVDGNVGTRLSDCVVSVAHKTSPSLQWLRDVTSSLIQIVYQEERCVWVQFIYCRVLSSIYCLPYVLVPYVNTVQMEYR
jgi:hypothetical protein